MPLPIHLSPCIVQYVVAKVEEGRLTDFLLPKKKSFFRYEVYNFPLFFCLQFFFHVYHDAKTIIEHCKYHFFFFFNVRYLY